MKEHRGMPTRLFTLIDGDVTAEAAEALRRSTPECLRDQWCRQFMHTYADMMSPEAQAVLILQASLHKFDIGQIERRHSSIRRWLHARGLQTHVFEFQRRSAEWMAQQLRAHEAARSMRTLQPPAEAEPHTTNSSRSKKKRGGGGACRAYFSEALRRKRVKLTDAGVARQLHVEYTALGMAEKRRLCAVGKRAAKAWAKGDSKSTSAFGLKRKRDRLAEVNRTRNAALWRSLRAVGPEERLAVIVKQVFSSRSAAEHYRTLLRRARSVTLQDTTCSKVAKRHGVALLNAWEEGEGKGQTEELIRAIGASGDAASTLRTCLRPEPCQGLTMLRYEPPVAESATDAAAWAHSEHASADLRKALAEDWQRRHFAIMDADCLRVPATALVHPPDPMPVSKCLPLGVCVCSARGKRVAKAVASMYTALKAAYPRDQRGLLVDGFVVCQLYKTKVDDSLLVNEGGD